MMESLFSSSLRGGEADEAIQDRVAKLDCFAFGSQ